MMEDEVIDIRERSETMFDDPLPVTRSKLNKIVIFLYRVDKTTATGIKKNVVSEYTSKVEFLSERGIIQVEKGRGRKKIYSLTEKGKKIAKYIMKANELYLKSEDKEKIICKSCAASNQKEANFCHKCGERLEEDLNREE